MPRRLLLPRRGVALGSLLDLATHARTRAANLVLCLSRIGLSDLPLRVANEGPSESTDFRNTTINVPSKLACILCNGWAGRSSNARVE